MRWPHRSSQSPVAYIRLTLYCSARGSQCGAVTKGVKWLNVDDGYVGKSFDNVKYCKVIIRFLLLEYLMFFLFSFKCSYLLSLNARQCWYRAKTHVEGICEARGHMNMWPQPAIHMICCWLCMITMFCTQNIGLEQAGGPLLLKKKHSYIGSLKDHFRIVQARPYFPMSKRQVETESFDDNIFL